MASLPAHNVNMFIEPPLQAEVRSIGIGNSAFSTVANNVIFEVSKNLNSLNATSAKNNIFSHHLSKNRDRFLVSSFFLLVSFFISTWLVLLVLPFVIGYGGMYLTVVYDKFISSKE